jgi:hypothetical protein
VLDLRLYAARETQKMRYQANLRDDLRPGACKAMCLRGYVSHGRRRRYATRADLRADPAKYKNKNTMAKC